MKFYRNSICLLNPCTLFFGISTISACAYSGGMNSGNLQIHDSLQITTNPIVLAPYGPILGCTYTQDLTTPNNVQITEQFNLHATPLTTNTNDLFVTETKTTNEISSYLIEINGGKLLDFNSIDPTDGQRYTPENATQVEAQAFANSPPAKYATNPQYLNGFELFMPEFEGANFVPNDEVAKVTQVDGNVWATYIYRGSTEYNGVQGALFDLMRTDENGTRLAGFMIFDLKTMTPILSILDAGTTAIFKRQSCQ